MTIELNWVNDDLCNVYFDDVFMWSLTYDLLGREGLNSAIEIICQMAHVYSCEVVET